MPLPVAGRWYGGNVLMPDGTSYVTGGDLGPGSPRALGKRIAVVPPHNCISRGSVVTSDLCRHQTHSFAL